MTAGERTGAGRKRQPDDADDADGNELSRHGAPSTFEPSMTKTEAVGEDIEALCGRCGQVWHVVMAKMGEKIVKVVCKRCGAQHLYRTDQVADVAAGTGAATRASSGRRTRSRAAAEAPVPLPAFDPTKPPRPYSPAQSFTTGERVQHSTFGGGVVTGSPGPGKVEIAFPAGRRVLASAKVASSLARPTLAEHVPIADRPPDKM